MPFFSYIILSVMDAKIDDIKSWKLNEENTAFTEEEIIWKLKHLYLITYTFQLI